MQSFASPALQQLYGLPLSITAFVVTGYMLCGAAGMVVGGFLAARGERLERTIGACLLGAAVLLFAGRACGLLPGCWRRRWPRWRASAPAWPGRRATC